MLVHHIDFARQEVYEAGAILIALLAYPEANFHKQRGALHQSLCAMVLRARAASEPHWAAAPQSIKPVYALRALSAIQKDVKTLGRRLRDRMIAARMINPFLVEAATGKFPDLPEPLKGKPINEMSDHELDEAARQVKRWSINQMSQFVRDEAGQSEAGNVEARIYRPSLPVIHLAAAIARVLRLAEENGFPVGITGLESLSNGYSRPPKPMRRISLRASASTSIQASSFACGSSRTRFKKIGSP